MSKKRKAEFNTAVAAVFKSYKDATGVTSKDIAAALGVSAQSVTDIAGKLHETSLRNLAIIADTFKVGRVEFVKEILAAFAIGYADCK